MRGVNRTSPSKERPSLSGVWSRQSAGECDGRVRTSEKPARTCASHVSAVDYAERDDA
jgi:hypothetical protein